MATLDARDGGLYRIRLRDPREDSRIARREGADLSTAWIEDVVARMDERSASGAWTRTFLELVRKRPVTRAGDLAASNDMEPKPFKRRVRRLKEIGPTESLAVGSRLSPRGEVVLKRIAHRRRD